MRVMTRSCFWIAVGVLALVAAGCGKNFDAESQNASVTLDAGTEIQVAPLATLSPVTEQAGDEFTATLAEPLMKGEDLIAPKGTSVLGVVVDAKGAEPGDEADSFLSLELKEIMVSGGQSVAVTTEPVRYAPTMSEATSDMPAPAVVPEHTVLTFRLAEPVDVQVGIESNETEPIS